MTRSAVQKNRNSTLFCFWITNVFPFDWFYRAFLVILLKYSPFDYEYYLNVLPVSMATEQQFYEQFTVMYYLFPWLQSSSSMNNSRWKRRASCMTPSVTRRTRPTRHCPKLWVFFFFLLFLNATVVQGIPNHWEFRVSPRNLLKKFKQSMHFVNLNFVL